MTKRRFPRRARVAVALSALAAGLIAAAVIASAGAAKPPPNTLHLVAKSQKDVGFFPKHRPHQGSRFGFGDKLTGDDTGFDRGVCTIIGKQSLCTVQAKLSQGNLSLQGFVQQHSDHTPIAIVGGTGAYDGAGGTAFVTDVSQNKTDITVDFVH